MPDSEPLSLIPPLWFVQNLNAGRAREGLPPLGPLDGIVWLCWDTATRQDVQPLVIISGI
jgi:hypothetical protein